MGGTGRLGRFTLRFGSGDSASSRRTMRRMTAPWPAYQATRLDCLTAKLKRVRQRSSAFSAIACPFKAGGCAKRLASPDLLQSFEQPHDLGLGRVYELVHRHDALQRVAAVDEDA